MSKLLPNWQQSNVLEAVFDQLSDALVMYDNNHQITGVNRAAEKLFGASAEEMVGRNCREVFRCSSCEQNCGFVEGLLSAQTAVPHGTVRLHTEEGRERLVLIRTSQLHDDAGRVAGAVATVKDITDEVAPMKREVIAESAGMREVLSFVRKVAASEANTILLEGENGTGKDLIAKTLHYESARQAEPFIAINCAAIPDTLLESELFGYEKGAFTGANTTKPGRFEQADTGTAFLDEIGDVPAPIQVKLLRVLQEREFERLGSNKTLHIDVRIVAATNQDLRAALEQGTFREDLYYRLNVVPINIPPLRERPEDIPFLAEHFVKKLAAANGSSVESITEEAIQKLLGYHWPGNVRELENVIERSLVLSTGTRLDAADIRLDTAPRARQQASGDAFLPEGMSLDEYEQSIIREALRRAGGNKSQAARLLGLTRNALRYRLSQMGLENAKDAAQDS